MTARAIECFLTATEEMWDKSAVTPGVPTTSKRESSSIKGLALSNNDRGYATGQCTAESQISICLLLTWPMPPEAPHTTGERLAKFGAAQGLDPVADLLSL